MTTLSTIDTGRTRPLAKQARRVCTFCIQRATFITSYATWDVYRCDRHQEWADHLRAERELAA